jgi:hypothetical protein
MNSKTIKRCTCPLCGFVIVVNPDEPCPERCPACQNGKGGHWESERDVELMEYLTKKPGVYSPGCNRRGD